MALVSWQDFTTCTVRGGRQVLVAFYDDHLARNHDEPGGSATAVLSVGSRKVCATHIVTEIDQASPRMATLDAPSGRLRLTLTEFPVFLEPLDSR